MIYADSRNGPSGQARGKLAGSFPRTPFLGGAALNRRDPKNVVNLYLTDYINSRNGSSG